MAVGRLTPARRRDLTRTALVEAAAEVFARRGFHGASLEEIAETAGFTRGAIYKNFADKEELFFAVNDHINQRALAAFAEQLQRGTAASFDVRALAAVWRHADIDDAAYRALWLEFRLYELRNPTVRSRSVAHRDRTRRLVATFIQSNATANGLTLRIPAESLAAILLTASDGFALNSHPGEPDLYEAFLELIIPATIATASKPRSSRSAR